MVSRLRQLQVIDLERSRAYRRDLGRVDGLVARAVLVALAVCKGDDANESETADDGTDDNAHLVVRCIPTVRCENETRWVHRYYRWTAASHNIRGA